MKLNNSGHFPNIRENPYLNKNVLRMSGNSSLSNTNAKSGTSQISDRQFMVPMSETISASFSKKGTYGPLIS